MVELMDYRSAAGFLGLLCVSCASGGPAPTPPSPVVTAAVETTPVVSRGDAADDPAIWINMTDPARSLILGTEKQSGLYVYGLDGAVRQYLPVGRLNNVDVRQGISVGAFDGDIAVASNRTNDSVAVFTISSDGVVELVGSFPSAVIEPYGVCLGLVGDVLTAFVTHKTGEVVAYAVDGFSVGRETARLTFSSQLEGCVFDDARQVLYIGEENVGIWKSDFASGAPAIPMLIDRVGSETGLAADVEGLAIYAAGPDSGYLLASSQGNNLFIVYRRDGANEFIGNFAIVDGGGASGAIDGVFETDGIEATAAPLSPEFPRGIFVVQDGFNDAGKAPQNFKIVDWREIEKALDLAN